MKDIPERPEYVTEEVLQYMDAVRDAGEINPLAAGPYLEAAFDLSRQQARDAVFYWMRSYGERHPNN